MARLECKVESCCTSWFGAYLHACAPPPELIATVQVGSAISGECSVCQEVFVVEGVGVGILGGLFDVLKRAFAEHVLQQTLSTVCRA